MTEQARPLRAAPENLHCASSRNLLLGLLLVAGCTSTAVLAEPRPTDPIPFDLDAPQEDCPGCERALQTTERLSGPLSEVEVRLFVATNTPDSGIEPPIGRDLYFRRRGDMTLTIGAETPPSPLGFQDETTVQTQLNLSFSVAKKRASGRRAPGDPLPYGSSLVRDDPEPILHAPRF